MPKLTDAELTELFTCLKQLLIRELKRRGMTDGETLSILTLMIPYLAEFGMIHIKADRLQNQDELKRYRDYVLDSIVMTYQQMAKE